MFKYILCLNTFYYINYKYLYYIYKLHKCFRVQCLFYVLAYLKILCVIKSNASALYTALVNTHLDSFSFGNSNDLSDLSNATSICIDVGTTV